MRMHEVWLSQPIHPPSVYLFFYWLVVASMSFTIPAWYSIESNTPKSSKKSKSCTAILHIILTEDTPRANLKANRQPWSHSQACLASWTPWNPPSDFSFHRSAAEIFAPGTAQSLSASCCWLGLPDSRAEEIVFTPACPSIGSCRLSRKPCVDSLISTNLAAQLSRRRGIQTIPWTRSRYFKIWRSIVHLPLYDLNKMSPENQSSSKAPELVGMVALTSWVLWNKDMPSEIGNTSFFHLVLGYCGLPALCPSLHLIFMLIWVYMT